MVRGVILELVKPSLAGLPGYVDALQRGWSPDNAHGAAAALEDLRAIEADAAGFVDRLDDPQGSAGPVTLPDGSTVPRIPGFHRWLWDGEFCGVIGLRWQAGTTALPAHVLGHIGYGVTPWKQGRGYATRALALMLPQARQVGLAHVELTTDPDNLPSQAVILANGGRLVERIVKPAAFGGAEGLRYRIDL
jgi:predicted acetyltransferase